MTFKCSLRMGLALSYYAILHSEKSIKGPFSLRHRFFQSDVGLLKATIVQYFSWKCSVTT